MLLAGFSLKQEVLIQIRLSEIFIIQAVSYK